MEEVFAELFEIACELHFAIASTTCLFSYVPFWNQGLCPSPAGTALFPHPPSLEKWLRVRAHVGFCDEENGQDAFDTACVAVAPCSRTGLL